MKRKLLAAAVLVLAVALAWWRWPRAPEVPPRPRPQQLDQPDLPATDTGSGPTALDAPILPRTTFRGADLFGINEGVALPDRGLGIASRTLHIRATLDRRADQVSRLGATAVRASSHVFPELNFWRMAGGGSAGGSDTDPLDLDEINWKQADAFFTATGAAGLDVVAVIGPWPGARTSTFTSRYLPEDLEPYEQWVQAVVERYDGDGRDDMPGLIAPVLAWEIDNEPDLHNAEPPRDATGTVARPGEFQTPAQYATVLLATSRAIRRADPNAFILNGGIYRPMTPKGATYARRVLETPGVLDAIDALSLHCYFAEDSLNTVHRTMERARELAPELPVWITETSVPSGGRGEKATPDWQGMMLVGLYGAFIAEGADRIFWHTLLDPPQREGPSGFGSNSLFWTTGTDVGRVRAEIKPAGEAYQRLAARMEDVDLSTVHEIPSGDGRTLQTDHGWLVFWGEATPPEEAETAEDLVTGEVEPISGPVKAPAWLK